jgi:hypothetical protein
MMPLMRQEAIRKSLLYLQRTETYWRLSPRIPGEATDAVIGHYPLDLRPRLRQGHFSHFDEAEIPLQPSPRGLVHNYTRICAFALAHWSLYLDRGERQDLRPIVAAADYLLETADSSQGDIRLRAERSGAGHTGPMSAMYQGEAISVLCRAHAITGQERYLEAAKLCLPSFQRPVSADGVVGTISGTSLTWYEEDVRAPLRHILNGMVYALWGLRDLAEYGGNQLARELHEQGSATLEEVITHFDSGWWSWYDLPEQGRPYIASMMYHNLHICQLRAVGREAGKERILRTAERFDEYARRPANRIRAALALAGAKLRRDYGH